MRHLRADLAHLNREQFRIVHLDSRNGLLQSEIVSKGMIDQAMVHAREVARRALELGSASLILVHNHPSGATSPSRADLDVTKSVVAACRIVGICVHDHVIIGAGGHYSLPANGHMHTG